MFVWHRLVQTPVKTLCLRQFCTPCMVLLRTPARPRRSSLTISLPSTLMSGVTLPSWRIRLARSVGDEVAVGEDLEVAIGVLGQHVEQVRVHERLAADDAEEDVAHLLGLARPACRKRVGRDDLLLGGDVHPAALAAQVAAVDDRDVQERREVLAALAAARLCFSTDSIPFQPMFQASFQSRRLSVSSSRRLAIFSRYMAVPCRTTGGGSTGGPEGLGLVVSTVGQSGRSTGGGVSDFLKRGTP